MFVFDHSQEHLMKEFYESHNLTLQMTFTIVDCSSKGYQKKERAVHNAYNCSIYYSQDTIHYNFNKDVKI